MKIMTLIALFIAFTAQAKECDLSKGLSRKQIKVLKKANRLKRIGPNRTLLGKHVYKVDILKDSYDQFIVLLGEAHIKGIRSSRLGKKIVKNFNLRMLEGIPKAEAEYIQENNDQLDDALGWKRVLASVLTFNIKGSTITDAQKRGLTFLPGYQGILLNRDVIADVKTKTASEVLKYLPNLIQNTERGLNLPLEVGPFLTPSEDDSYILDERNVRMVSNIVTYLDSDLVNETPLAIVGAAHNPGMIDLLRQDGYKRCNF